MATSYLEITLKIDEADRANTAGVYAQYKTPFLETIQGATSKELLIRDEDVQVLHCFETAEYAQNYLSSELFNRDVVAALKPYFKGQSGHKDLYSSLVWIGKYCLPFFRVCPLFEN